MGNRDCLKPGLIYTLAFRLSFLSFFPTCLLATISLAQRKKSHLLILLWHLTSAKISKEAHHGPLRFKRTKSVELYSRDSRLDREEKYHTVSRASIRGGSSLGNTYELVKYVSFFCSEYYFWYYYHYYQTDFVIWRIEKIMWKIQFFCKIYRC